ncbi:MAG: thio(seleno)oxazole modification radical SAM maturase SbtM [Thermodesulfobacteriota bacterium]|nr:thio(seleno)oxazole modification radical SAM maturase SbtM [Thermodesulfobacteriota bacterium]
MHFTHLLLNGIPTAETIYPATRRLSGDRFFYDCLNNCDGHPERLADVISYKTGKYGLPRYLADLGRLEYACCQAVAQSDRIPSSPPGIILNPTLTLLTLEWKNVCRLLSTEADASPTPGEEIVLIWIDPETRDCRCRPASDNDLLVLKMVVEDISIQAVAEQGGILPGNVWARIRIAARKGLVLTPSSGIVRDPDIFPRNRSLHADVYAASVFTLQWHITQACDLNCKHCYDRTGSDPLPFESGLAVLDDFTRFCIRRNVSGHISFSGGNPLLHSRFVDLYQAASQRGFSLGILGNPTDRHQIREITDIETPAFYQVSLEGLADHNDDIRGSGHFEYTLAFLDMLRECGVYSMVMLTLTRDNMDQVIPLAEMLEGRADLFTFNRLAQVGRGMDLLLPEKDAYLAFLKEFRKSADRLSVVARKDNLINAVLDEQGLPLFGGCTGHGCGAAFNFISLLPDGAVHACRKFPSPIGNAFSQALDDIYESPTARQYRSGAAACHGCRIRPVCGGCLAVAYGCGLDVFSEKDPFCPGVAGDMA